MGEGFNFSEEGKRKDFKPDTIALLFIFVFKKKVYRYYQLRKSGSCNGSFNSLYLIRHMRRFNVLKDSKGQEVGECPVVYRTVGSKIYIIKGGGEKRNRREWY
jgi:hypothetical protein